MTPWTVARQAPLSMRFSRQEYWSGLPCPPPGDIPNPGIEPASPALQADSLHHGSPGDLGTQTTNHIFAPPGSSQQGAREEHHDSGEERFTPPCLPSGGFLTGRDSTENHSRPDLFTPVASELFFVAATESNSQFFQCAEKEPHPPDPFPPQTSATSCLMSPPQIFKSPPGFQHPRAPSLRLYNFLCSLCSFRPRDGICFPEVVICVIPSSSLFTHLVINICISNGKEAACQSRRTSSIPGWRRSPGEGYVNPLQYSCLENSMTEEPGWSTVLQKSDTTEAT